ncbi:TIM barrel protein [Methanobrevibacter filiformis]|uniref:Putative endonuclease 4 n=1 Tax=Methanobrevibacter filiformis TaxID=55758 RepID=A0A166A471_9EURY|nr:TIM barrel protein [Methanobrevibacter filiformis]KZX11541.1 putative endonuclease 4 [Methanobrevibacter filiformis]
MEQKIIFGPAGRPLGYKGPAYKACDFIKEEGLDAYEYQAGRGLRISEKSSKILKDNSKNNNVLVSIHAPYFINLSSDKEKTIDNSIEMLFKAAEVAEWMGAYRIVFHPGYYSKYSKDEALKIAKSSITKLLEDLEIAGISEFTFAPETTGKRSQLGNIDEIIAICNEFDKFEPTIDFAHLHARGRGFISEKDDYNKILSKLEDELDINKLHCHFTRIEYTKSGEKKHHTLDEEDYGPEPQWFIESLVENDWNATIICESPNLDLDAIKLREIYEKLI